MRIRNISGVDKTKSGTENYPSGTESNTTGTESYPSGKGSNTTGTESYSSEMSNGGIICKGEPGH